jgi:phosphoglycolate phosphatase
MPLIVFDLDGTLVDSRADLAASTNDMLESYGVAPLPVDAVSRMIGEGARVLVERALTARHLTPYPPDALERFRTVYDRRLLETTVPYPGTAEMLAGAASIAPLAVLTNKPLAPARQILDALGLARHFQWILGGDGPHPRKPDPAGLVWLTAQANVVPADAMMVGDSHIDADTAARAGTAMCVVRYGFGWTGPIASAAAAADSAQDVLRVIETWRARRVIP